MLTINDKIASQHSNYVELITNKISALVQSIGKLYPQTFKAEA